MATDGEAEVLVSDDHGAYQEVVDETGLAHQRCRHHVKENVDNLAEELAEQLQQHETSPSPPQAKSIVCGIGCGCWSPVWGSAGASSRWLNTGMTWMAPIMPVNT